MTYVETIRRFNNNNHLHYHHHHHLLLAVFEPPRLSVSFSNMQHTLQTRISQHHQTISAKSKIMTAGDDDHRLS